MSSRSASFFAGRYRRRAVTFPATILAAVVLVATLPVTLVIAALLDRGGPWQRVRIILLLTGGLLIEIFGIVGSLVAWLTTGLWFFRRRPWSWRSLRWLMGVYTATHLWWITKVLGTHIEWRSDELEIDGPVVMLARHTSFFDALIPGAVLAHHNKLLGHHVLAGGLRYMPCIDIVGHRFPNVFVDRTPGEGSAALADIERVGASVGPRGAGIIFPEGTFRTPARYERAMVRLRESNPIFAAQAENFDNVLPPRPHGSRALLRGAATSDVIVCMNTGFEPFGTLAEMRASLVADRPIIVEAYRIPRSEVPAGDDEFDQWMMDLFERMDHWVDAQMSQTEACDIKSLR